MSRNTELCRDIVVGILDTFLRESPVKPTFNNFKRPAAPSPQSQKKMRIEAYEDEIASLMEKNSHLESQLSLVTANLNFEAQNKDHWRTSTQTARKELEKLQEENRELLMKNMETEGMFHDQTQSCMKVLGEILRIVWSLSNSSESLNYLTSGTQLLEFLQISTKILSQFQDRESSSSLEAASELDMVSSVLGCLVNISSSSDVLMSSLTGSDELHSLIDAVVSYLDGCQDQKLLLLGFMVLDNLLRTDFKFKRQENVLSAETSKCLSGILTRWTRGDKGKASLLKVAERLQNLMEESFLSMGESEQ